MCSDFISINLILICIRCFIRYKDTAHDLWIFFNYQHATDTTNGGCIFIVVSTNFFFQKVLNSTHNAALRQGRIPLTILFAQFFDKFYQPKVQWLSRHIGYISVQAFRLVSCKETRLDCWIFVFLPFCQSRKIFTDHIVTAHDDFRIAFSIKFLSSFAFLGFRKALQ